ncbi:hypothetical protein HNP84_009736 [Thermocatellispora tengchongensis]|uniref:Uncharacterized protein n=1 Tax=Thermocatellispora tengchongensis TaxID=1073253 RepID=A0A840PQC1_9ACTN|nr:hypothetical protein [Thermocatellispora tengchongensis]MBB5139971.1 hypothetical protein [Thermocatellispora tengchongensis]
MEPISSLSREFLYIPVKGPSGGEGVEVAFTNEDGEPTETDWHDATWDNVTAAGADAKILVGPGEGAVSLPEGTYRAWVRVTSSVEQPVLPGGLVPVI